MDIITNDQNPMLDLWAEESEADMAAGCCAGSAGSMGSISTPVGCAGSVGCASTAGC
ncbi:thiocillin family RiPP [Amycolatopsis keratiniphila]|uniref:thiocillin family RiPP n=1 Tax=Amycolatopsis keratiniphila TaxID=129921 RepID=UPI00087A2E2D|nr:thiocillin family RiPP [Amycolatopsis keratiniphila]SDU10096.1 hypothetical protein SAMN04489733_1134 [Amycolatopsis keratiniphila]